MDLFNKLYNDNNLIEDFCDVLEKTISDAQWSGLGLSSYKPNITYKVTGESIFFFIESSAILQIIPDKELQYTYANVPGYGDEVKRSIDIITRQINRDEKIENILNKKRE